MTRDRVEVLVLEDNPGDARLLEAELAAESLVDVRLTFATRLSEGLALLAAREFDAILLDLNLPDSSGMETFEHLRAAVPELPLIVYSGIDRDDIALRALRSGAQDYLVKAPGIGPLLIRAIYFAIERHRVRVELDLRAARVEKSRATLRRIIEASPDGIIILDRAGAVRFVSAGDERLYGLDASELVERFRSLPPGVLELEIALPDGAVRTAEAHSVEIEWDGEPASMLSLHDVTGRKRAQAEIEAANLLLEERVRERTAALTAANGELEAFAYSVSHDLRAPLRHIQGFTQMLEEAAGPVLDAEARTLLGRILRGADRMQHLIDDLLAFSRMGRCELTRAPVALAAMAQELIDEFAPETCERTVIWAIESLPELDADSSLLRVVLVNLLSNALKFTRGRDTARIEIFSPGPATVAVRDNGAGFDPAAAGRLFGVFQRLHSQAEFEGTGVGLATVKRIVNRHGGRIWAESTPGQGATFFFSIPAHATDPTLHADMSC